MSRGLMLSVICATVVTVAGCGSSAAVERPDICDPAYPTVCISSPPPVKDCEDITYTRFKVLSPDPHRFDLDKDGIGCEDVEIPAE